MRTDFGLGHYFGMPRAKSARAQAHDKAMAAERAGNASKARQARALAARFGVKIERESAGAYWVTHPQFSGSADPLDGSNFCTTGAEVLAAVEAYAVHLARHEGSPVAAGTVQE